MVGKLKTETKQIGPEANLNEAVTLNIMQTAEFVMGAIAEVIKTEQLTLTQYNALRILRGAGADGLICSEIGDRMITKESDITRLLDRLETRGLIRRERPVTNRRIVIATISSDGLDVLKRLDPPVADRNQALSSMLTKAQQNALIGSLSAIRTIK